MPLLAALSTAHCKVYAVDEGYNQLAWKLRTDDRVIVLEKTNARYLDQNIIPEQADMLTADVSFISLTLAMPSVIQNLLKDGGEIVCLIKPQFEAGRELVGKGGIVRDPEVHHQVVNKVLSCFNSLEAGVQALDYSPITGSDGNIEYLLYAIKGQTPSQIDINQIINAAHQNFRKQ